MIHLTEPSAQRVRVKTTEEVTIEILVGEFPKFLLQVFRKGASEPEIEYGGLSFGKVDVNGIYRPTLITVKPVSVDSSNIDTVCYDPSQWRLFVTFKNGGTYHYDHVPAKLAGEFMQASSVGKFLAEHIKNTYPATKIDKELVADPLSPSPVAK